MHIIYKKHDLRQLVDMMPLMKRYGLRTDYYINTEWYLLKRPCQTHDGAFTHATIGTSEANLPENGGHIYIDIGRDIGIDDNFHLKWSRKQTRSWCHKSFRLGSNLPNMLVHTEINMKGR